MSAADINYDYKLEIDVTPTSTATWAIVGAGISNIAKTLNEVLQQASYLNDAGWGSTEVVGGQLIVTLTGDRVRGDVAQDYIYSADVQYKFGQSRHTHFRITAPDGTGFTGNVTIANADDGGGDSTATNAISFEIHFNGAPVPFNSLGELTVVSVAGATSGKTKIYVNPAKGGSNSYKYQTNTTVSLPLGGAILTTGWTAWDGTAEITAATGNKIVVAEIVTATNAAAKAGIATVTSM